RQNPKSEIRNSKQARIPRSRPIRISDFEFPPMPEASPILNAPAIQRALTRIAHEIAEHNEVSRDVVLIGFQRPGVPLARRLAMLLSGIWGQPVPTGSLDVSMHRDDLDQRAAPN